MAPHYLHTGGGGSAISLKLQEAIVSGILVGFSAFLARAVMVGVTLDYLFLLGFFLNPVSWGAGMLGVLGFFYLQKSLYVERLSYVVPTFTAISIITPVIMSVVFLGDRVGLLRWVGIWFILLGIIGINRGEWDEGLLASIIRWFRRGSR